MFLLKIDLEFNSAKQSKEFFNSIKKELEKENSGSLIRISQKQAMLFVEISASSKVALRTSLNLIKEKLILFNLLEDL